MRREATSRDPAPETIGVAVGQVERHLFLRSFGGFAEIEPEHIAVLAEYAQERVYTEGSYLFRAGEPVDRIEFIVRGRVEVRRHGEKLREMGPKTSVGGLAAFADDPYGYDVIALEDCLTLSQRVDDAVDIFEDHFPLLRGVLRAISRELLEIRRSMNHGAGFSGAIDEGCDCSPNPLDLVERMALIQNTMTFAGSRVDAVADLAREAKEVRIAAGETLWREGDPSGEMLILVSGVLECETQAGQRFRFGPGDSVGALDGNAGVPRWFTASVSHDLVGLQISMESLYDVFEDNFEWAMNLLELLARALLSMLDKRAGLSPDSTLVD